MIGLFLHETLPKRFNYYSRTAFGNNFIAELASSLSWINLKFGCDEESIIPVRGIRGWIKLCVTTSANILHDLRI